MKRDLIFVLSLCLVVASITIGCKKIRPGCILSEKASPVLSNVIVKKAACKKPEVILAGVTDFCNNGLGLCRDEVKQTGPIAAIVCPMLGSFGKTQLAAMLEKNDLLKRGECDPNVAASSIVDPLVAGCTMLPF